MPRKFLRCAWLGIAAISALAIAVRMLAGPFDVLVPVRTPLNPEGWLGLALVILLASGGGSCPGGGTSRPARL